MKHLSVGLRVSLAMVFCSALLAPGALADNGKKPPDERPGNSVNAPGHTKGDDAPPAAVATPEAASTPPTAATAPEPTPETARPESGEAEGADATGHPVPAPPDKPTNAKSERPAKPEKTTPETPARPGGTGRPPGARGSAGEGTAHSKVLICHATGSATNPYVLISVSVNAWSKGSGHGAHADDVFVDWSWPGDPRQKDDALCTRGDPPGTTTTSPGAGTTTPSSSSSSTANEPGDHGVKPSSAPPADREHLGPTLAPPAARTVETPARDVLTTRARLAATAVRGTLPFTGLPLWAIALAGLGLVAGGLAVQRRAEPKPARSRKR